MYRDSAEVPSPRRRCAQNEIYPQPQDKQRPIEARGAANELRPRVVRKVFPNMTRVLYARITRESVIVEDELKVLVGSDADVLMLCLLDENDQPQQPRRQQQRRTRHAELRRQRGGRSLRLQSGVRRCEAKHHGLQPSGSRRGSLEAPEAADATGQRDGDYSGNDSGK